VIGSSKIGEISSVLEFDLICTNRPII